MSLPPENDRGDTEYKLIVGSDRVRIEGLKTQMAGRLSDGDGKAFYWVGVMDSGAMVGISQEYLKQSIENLSTIAGEIGAKIDHISFQLAKYDGDVNAELRPFVPKDEPRYVAKLTIHGDQLQDPFCL